MTAWELTEALGEVREEYLEPVLAPAAKKKSPASVSRASRVSRPASTAGW